MNATNNVVSFDIARRENITREIKRIKDMADFNPVEAAKAFSVITSELQRLKRLDESMGIEWGE